MAFNDFRKGGARETDGPVASGGGGGGGVGALTAFIDQGSEFSGKLSFKDTVRIDGRFEGEIRSENTLIVGETGQVHANISSETVVVSGEVEGDIQARNTLQLHKTARVVGNVQAKSLIVEDGAIIDGRVEMSNVGKNASAAPKPGKSDKSDKPESPEAKGGSPASS